uniref:Uncharacterized protein n=1 Tax=Arundo donax TaxID=35708 RepID=A0A0A9G5D1_ARUDO
MATLGCVLSLHLPLPLDLPFPNSDEPLARCYAPARFSPGGFNSTVSHCGAPTRSPRRCPNLAPSHGGSVTGRPRFKACPYWTSDEGYPLR